MSLKTGKLWIVATPLGNPGDLSPRARQTLAAVDGILAEDTRRTGRLLAECGIAAPPLTTLHDHNESGRLSGILGWLEEGKHLALVSDAGTPLLSDPGYLLVKACREAGIAVSPLPGPSAVATALSASGLPPLPFAFLGFLPRKQKEQERLLLPFSGMAVTLVFFERKDRLRQSLATAFSVLGPREGCIARELTKTYEEFIPFQLAEYDAVPEDLLGEITVVLGPPHKGMRDGEEHVLYFLGEELAIGGKPKDVARRVSQQVVGWTAKDVYELMQGKIPPCIPKATM